MSGTVELPTPLATMELELSDDSATSIARAGSAAAQDVVAWACLRLRCATPSRERAALRAEH